MVVMETVCGVDVSEIPDVLSSSSINRCLVVDCRSFLAFNQSRIAQAINIHCPPILKRRSGGFIALENIVPCETKRNQLLQGIYDTVLVYDESTQELIEAPSDSNIQSVITSLLKQVEKLTVRFIKGGFQAVQDQCPVLCVNVRLSNPMRDKLPHRGKQSRMNEPSEILPHVYLGDVSHSAQRALLEKLGITALLNVSSSCHNHFETSYTYKNVTVSDNMDADLMTWFPELIDFIESVSTQQGRVLVHCRAGVSRSATVCIAYIMHKQGLSLDSAYEFVKSKRPVIDPNINFIRQLQKFETLLKSRQKPIPHSQSQSRVKHPPPPLLLRPPPCSLACSLQTHSAPLIASSGSSSNKQQCPLTPQVFTFSAAELQSTQTVEETSSSLPPSEQAQSVEMEIASPSPQTPSQFVYPPGDHHVLPPAPSLQTQPVPRSPLPPLSVSHQPQDRPGTEETPSEARLSPCSLSQTAASPSPVCHPPAIDVFRPDSLPLLQISSPHRELPSSQQHTFLLPSPGQHPSTPFLPSPAGQHPSTPFFPSPAGQHPSTPFFPSPAGQHPSTPFLPSPVGQHPSTPFLPAGRPTSPLFSFLPQGPEEGIEASALNYPEIPRTPRDHRQFDFFGVDSPGEAGGNIPSDVCPSLHRPASPAHPPFLGPEFPASVNLPRSPVSPLGFPLSPLHSPLPSCG